MLWPVDRPGLEGGIYCFPFFSTCLHLYEHMDFCSIHWALIHFCVLFRCSDFPDLAIEDLFQAGWPLCNLISPQHSLSISFLSGRTRCIGLILYFPSPGLECLFSKEFCVECFFNNWSWITVANNLYFSFLLGKSVSCEFG